MTLAEMMFAELEQSVPVTRKHLERLPEDQLGWRPSEKSMSLGQLALHIAMAPGEIARLAMQDTMEVPDFQEFPRPSSVAEVLEALDRSLKTARESLRGATDAYLQETLPFTKNGQQIMAMPRITFLREIMLNHLYHHRGQLSVYLRLLGVPVPPSFGPTADESFMPASAAAV